MLIEFTFGDMVEGLSPDGRATVSVYTHGGSTIERLKTHTHKTAQCLTELFYDVCRQTWWLREKLPEDSLRTRGLKG